MDKTVACKSGFTSLTTLLEPFSLKGTFNQPSILLKLCLLQKTSFFFDTFCGVQSMTHVSLS